jgi:hypothetical protein
LVFQIVWKDRKLALAKRDAWQAMSQYGSEERANLNTVPIRIEISKTPLTVGDMQEEIAGTSRIVVPNPLSRTPGSASLILRYPSFLVRIMEPISSCPCDALAKKMGLADAFSLELLLYRTRLDDIDRQPDLYSLEQHMTLLWGKSELLKQRQPPCAISRFLAEFQRGNLRGIICAANKEKSQYVAYLNAGGQNCSLAFTDAGGMTFEDVRKFLGAVQFGK